MNGIYKYMNIDICCGYKYSNIDINMVVVEWSVWEFCFFYSILFNSLSAYLTLLMFSSSILSYLVFGSNCMDR